MNRICTSAFVIGSVLVATFAPAAAASTTNICTVQPVFEFDTGAAEGLAMSPNGDVFVGNINTGEIWFAPHGDFTRATLLADLVVNEHSFTFVLGMDVTSDGTLFVAVNSFVEPGLHGLWRVEPDGTATLAASFAPYPSLLNDVAIDPRGNVYVSDSLRGEIWRLTRAGQLETWSDSPLWKSGDGDLFHPIFGIPFGVNGLTYHHGALYGATYLDGRIVRVPIAHDGTAGEPQTIVDDAGLVGADGIEVDVSGDIYVTVNDADSLVRIDANEMRIEPLISGLSAPASIAVSKNRKTIYIANLSSSAPRMPPAQRAPAVMAATQCR